MHGVSETEDKSEVDQLKQLLQQANEIIAELREQQKPTTQSQS